MHQSTRRNDWLRPQDDGAGCRCPPPGPHVSESCYIGYLIMADAHRPPPFYPSYIRGNQVSSHRPGPLTVGVESVNPRLAWSLTEQVDRLMVPIFEIRVGIIRWKSDVASNEMAKRSIAASSTGTGRRQWCSSLRLQLLCVLFGQILRYFVAENKNLSAGKHIFFAFVWGSPVEQYVEGVLGFESLWRWRWWCSNCGLVRFNSLHRSTKKKKKNVVEQWLYFISDGKKISTTDQAHDKTTRQI